MNDPYIENLFNGVSSCGGCDTAQESCVNYCDLFAMDDPNCMLTCHNPYYLNCVDSHCSESSESTSDSLITSEQITGIGNSLVQGGSSLFGIGIQLLPYLILVVIVFIIFLFIKRFGNLNPKI